MFDLAIDKTTGDLLFGPHRDLVGVMGSAVVDQRIIVRCRIPRGTFTYDEEGTLGSRLHTISSHDSERQKREAAALVAEALEPMDDIRLNNIDVSVDEKNRLLIQVKWSPVVASTEGDDVVVEPTPEYDALVTY